jgi:hypothetical protein
MTLYMPLVNSWPLFDNSKSASVSYTVIHMADPVLGDHWIEVDGTLEGGPASLNTPG